MTHMRVFLRVALKTPLAVKTIQNDFSFSKVAITKDLLTTIIVVCAGGEKKDSSLRAITCELLLSM